MSAKLLAVSGPVPAPKTGGGARGANAPARRTPRAGPCTSARTRPTARTARRTGPAHGGVVVMPLVHAGAPLEGRLPRVARLDGGVQSINNCTHVPVQDIEHGHVPRTANHLVGDFSKQAKGVLVVLPGGRSTTAAAVRGTAGNQTRPASTRLSAFVSSASQGGTSVFRNRALSSAAKVRSRRSRSVRKTARGTSSVPASVNHRRGFLSQRAGARCRPTSRAMPSARPVRESIEASSSATPLVKGNSPRR